MESIYKALLEANVPLDHRESDLYVKRTPESIEIVNAYYHRGDIRTMFSFKSNIDGEMWIEIPFCYAPFWEKKQASAS